MGEWADVFKRGVSLCRLEQQVLSAEAVVTSGDTATFALLMLSSGFCEGDESVFDGAITGGPMLSTHKKRVPCPSRVLCERAGF